MTNVAQPIVRRFRIRFHLRSVLVLVTVLSVGFAWVAAERRKSVRQRHIADQLADHGFTFRFGGPFDSYERHTKMTPQGWWRDVARVILGDRVLGAACDQYTELKELTALAELTDLQTLELADTNISNVSQLSGLRELRDLDLSGTEVSDLRPLASLTKLQGLGLNRTPVSDLRPLAGLSELDNLWLIDARVKDISPLMGLRMLVTLEVRSSNVEIDEAQLEQLRKSLPKLDRYMTSMESL